MDESALYDILDQYFDSFQRKDVVQMRGLVANDICLRDWDTQAIGLDDFLTANQAIFESFDEIRIKRVATDIVEKKAFCLIEVIERLEPNHRDGRHHRGRKGQNRLG